ncbi:MAG: ABC transporter permease subunit [Dehalococcoidia bacterium]
MNATIVALTLRQVLGQRRSVLMLAGAALPILIAFLFTFNNGGPDDPTPERFSATILLGRLVTNAVLPIVALVFGTAVLGAEIEEGTAVYLLSKPISRARIILSKLVVAWVATAVVVVPSAAVASVVALEGSDADGISVAFALALIAGSLAYCALFVLLSVVTSRALIVGLLYVFIWEGVVTNLFSGTRLLSIREFTLAVADALTPVRASAFDANLGPVQGMLLMAAIIIGATAFATRRLERFEIGEST